MSTESDVEALRWETQELTCASPDEYEARWKKPWVAPDTRNHRLASSVRIGISREVRRAGDDLAIEDEHAEIAARLIVGRTIVGFRREPYSGVDWEMGSNSVTLFLDDGSRLEFDGWGHDASGLHTTYHVPAVEEKQGD